MENKRDRIMRWSMDYYEGEPIHDLRKRSCQFVIALFIPYMLFLLVVTLPAYAQGWETTDPLGWQRAVMFGICMFAFFLFLTAFSGEYRPVIWLMLLVISIIIPIALKGEPFVAYFYPYYLVKAIYFLHMIKVVERRVDENMDQYEAAEEQGVPYIYPYREKRKRRRKREQNNGTNGR